MQLCTSFQTDNHASTPLFSFLQAGCPSCHPTSTEGNQSRICTVYMLCVGAMAERNLNPKAACLKRREEEKGAEFLTAQSTSVYADPAAQPLVVRILRNAYLSLKMC